MGSVGAGVFMPLIAFSFHRKDRSEVTFHHNLTPLGTVTEEK